MPWPAAAYREGEVKSFFEIMLRAREKEEIVVGLKRHGPRAAPELNPADKHVASLSLQTVRSFVVVLTGVDPDKPSRHASWTTELAKYRASFHNGNIAEEPDPEPLPSFDAVAARINAQWGSSGNLARVASSDSL
jgi:hypothetical protein